MLALAQALFVLQLMPQIGVVQNGVDSWRVQFWWKGDALTVPNRPTMEEAELDKARLEAAPDEDKPGIITAIEAEKKKAEQEAEAQQKAEEAKKETEQLPSKLYVRRHYAGYRMVFKHPIHTKWVPTRSSAAEPDLTDNELQERAQKDRQEVFDKAWDGMSAADVAQLVQSLTQQSPTLKKQGHVQDE